MNLKNKIMITFGGTVLAAIAVVGSFSTIACNNIAMKNVNNSLATEAILASGEISSEISNAIRMVEATATDPIISQESSTATRISRLEELVDIYGFTSGNILDTNGVSLIDGTDFSDRKYVQDALNGTSNISDIILSKYTNTYGFSVATPIRNASNQVEGVIYYRMDIDFIDNILEKLKVSKNSTAYIVDDTSTIIVHEDESMVNNVSFANAGGDLAGFAKEMEENQYGYSSFTSEEIKYVCGYSEIENTNGWRLILNAPESDYTDYINESVLDLLGVDAIILLFALVVAYYFAHTIGKTANRVEGMLEKISKGDFSTKISKSKSKDELGKLQNSAYELQETLSAVIQETNTVLGTMASYDLSVNDMKGYPGVFDELSNSVNEIKAILCKIISEVQESANAVGTGSGELALAADALSQGTVAQAASIDKVVLEIQEITEKIVTSSENEDLVEKRLRDLEHLIGDGNKEMTELLQVVKEVADMSSDIQKIVGTIDSIAFQTNILALNASVEAARAGDNGKGFAVVADEVGSLAAKTSEASKQTSELIGRCIDRINNAMHCADVTFDCLGNIVNNSAEISKAFEDIAIKTKEQAEKSSYIRQEMTVISDVVQNNTATAEESAAATQELSALASGLTFLMQKFKIR